jgi:hypothetical protein
LAVDAVPEKLTDNPVDSVGLNWRTAINDPIQEGDDFTRLDRSGIPITPNWENVSLEDVLGVLWSFAMGTDVSFEKVGS